MAGAQSAWQWGSESATKRNTDDSPQGAQSLFLLRLRRLIALRRNSGDHVDGVVLKALDRCIYSTYCDCLEAGVGDEARVILR